MSSNTTLVGNLTRDPELKYSTQATAIVSFGLAVNRRYQSHGEWKEETMFMNVVVFGEMAENVAASLGKGDRCLVTGRLQQRSWETDAGEKRSVVEVVADSIGPDLRWATARIAKTERTSGSSGGSTNSNPTPEYGDEEPF